tara:strand:+ start:272 stop:712 length:441 start_codon:yes stop_codon:yes gene_type:complete
MDKIIEDKFLLSEVCQPVDTLEEGNDIAKRLWAVLDASRSGIGLAANQIGINKRVCVIRVRKPIVLINPKIVGSFGRISFNEGCLSFPGQSILTERYANILVEADNLNEPRIFNSGENMLECICVQHEIDHLDGKTMFDRQYTMQA